jgi:very-short-patch-repair endonuclease
LTKSEIDSISLNFESGFFQDYGYFEYLTRKYLDKKFDDIECQKTFNDCRSDLGRLLRFDFFSEKAKLAIECDGSQHYDPSHKFYSQEVKRRDQIKNEYCKRHGIRLVRIPYLGRFKTTREYIAQILETPESLIATAEPETVNVKA